MAWLGELKKRKVFRVAAAYAVVGWLLVQVTSVVLPALNLPRLDDHFYDRPADARVSRGAPARVEL